MRTREHMKSVVSQLAMDTDTVNRGARGYQAEIIAVDELQVVSTDLASLSGQLDALLDQFPCAALIIDQSIHIIRRNQVARQLLERRDILSDLNGQLTAANDRDALRFRTFLEQALLIPAGDSPDHFIALERHSSGRSCEIWAGILNQPPVLRNGGRDRGTTALICVVDPERPTLIPPRVLNSLFGLTDAEGRLAEAVLNGKSIEQFAEAAQITINTARTHLKAIFRKTDTNGQVDLVRLLSRLFLRLNNNSGLHGTTS